MRAAVGPGPGESLPGPNDGGCEEAGTPGGAGLERSRRGYFFGICSSRTCTAFSICWSRPAATSAGSGSTM